MKFRVARHTKDLNKVIHFYHGLLEMEILGRFEDHDNYDGVFLGFSNADWHLEFTVSNELPQHKPDEDDLLVFYFDDELKLNQIKNKLIQHNIKQVEAKNPYWNDNGFHFLDPDDFGIILTLNTNN